MLTAEQKIKQQLEANAHRFQHEGENVVRWLTGGTAPDAYVTFEQQGNEIIARCPGCQQELGRFDAAYGEGVYQQIAAIREAGSKHHCQEPAPTYH